MIAKFGWFVSAPVDMFCTTTRAAVSITETSPTGLCATQKDRLEAESIISDEKTSAKPVILAVTVRESTSIILTVGERI